MIVYNQLFLKDRLVVMFFFYIKLVRGKHYKGKLDLNHIDFRRKSSNVWQFYFVGLVVG